MYFTFDGKIRSIKITVEIEYGRYLTIETETECLEVFLK